MREREEPFRYHLLLVQDGVEPCGGKEAVFAWFLQALCPIYDVTVFTWNSSVNVAGLNRQYGTSIAASDFFVRRPSKALRALRRCLVAVDSDPASIQPALLLMRLAKRIEKSYDLAVSCEMETDLGAPGLQYIHYPWLEDFSGVLQAAEDFSRLDRVRSLLAGRLRPWMIVGGFSYRRMRTNRTLTNSDWTGRRVREAYGIEASTLYPPGPGNFGKIPWNQRKNGIICIGRIHPDKRIDWLIEVLKPLRSEIVDLHLHIVGKVGDTEGEQHYYRSLKKTARLHTSWITIHPGIPRVQLEELAVKQRYGVHAMIDEHFGMAIAEMVRAGCIPFVHQSGGATEIVDHDPRLLYETGEELCARILHVSRNSEEQSELLTNLSRGADRFSSERFIQDLRCVAASCLLENGSPIRRSLNGAG